MRAVRARACVHHQMASGAVPTTLSYAIWNCPLQLTVSGDLSYVGGNWTRDIAFAGTSVPLAVGGCG